MSSLPASTPMRRVIWSGLGVLVLLLLLRAVSPRSNPPAPGLPRYGQVTGFQLTNQFAQPVSSADLAGHIWVANIIFTRCPGPCVKMTRALASLQGTLPADSPVRIVSLTADPEFDTPDVLREYAGSFGADSNRWIFLTGRKPAVYDLAIKQLLLAVDDTDPAQRLNDADLFVHSTKFVLVDARGEVRGVFEGTEPEAGSQVLTAIDWLLQEPQP